MAADATPPEPDATGPEFDAPKSPTPPETPPRPGATGARFAAFVFGLLLIVPVVCLGLVAVFFGALGAQAPNPFVSDGTFCCDYPDTWGEVATTSGVSVAAAAGAALVAVIAVAFVVWGLSTRRIPRKAVGWTVGVATVGTTLAIGTVLALQAERVVVRPDCDTFRFDRRVWDEGAGYRLRLEAETVYPETREAERRDQRQMLGVAFCDGVVRGKTREQVGAILGRPARPDRRYWTYGVLGLRFAADGRVDQIYIREPYRPGW